MRSARIRQLDAKRDYAHVIACFDAPPAKYGYVRAEKHGYRTRIAYGVVFFEKDCYIVKAGEQKIPPLRKIAL